MTDEYTITKATKTDTTTVILLKLPSNHNLHDQVRIWV